MKKYISLLSLAAALSMQSCDREDPSTENMNHIQNRMESQSIQQIFAPANTKRDQTGTGSQETGDDDNDDEPKRDKQHWRVDNNSIKKIQVEI